MSMLPQSLYRCTALPKTSIFPNPPSGFRPPPRNGRNHAIVAAYAERGIPFNRSRIFSVVLFTTVGKIVRAQGLNAPSTGYVSRPDPMTCRIRKEGNRQILSSTLFSDSVY